jgi:hypothetical protein
MIGLNHYTELLAYVKQLALQDPLVKSVTQGDFDELDLKKGQERNLVHVDVTGWNMPDGGTVVMTGQIGVFADRRTYSKDNVDGFYGNTNNVDNLNETMAILNRIVTTMYKDFEDHRIEMTLGSSAQLYWNAATQLDGWILDFSVDMPNTVIDLCNE